MKKKIISCITNLLFLLLLPYLCTVMVNGAEIALTDHAPSMEECLFFIVSRQIEPDFEEEMIRAQTIIARTNMYRCYEEKSSFSAFLCDLQEQVPDIQKYWSVPWEIYEKAAIDTAGQVLTFDGELKLVPYHEISSGKTRDGEEVFHDRAYSYLKSVDSSADKESSEYLNSTYITVQQLPNTLNIKERDSSGYILSLLADENLLEGEAFRQGMGLTSSAFSIQKMGEEYRFLCKGKGHGLGLSQYGGNELAKSGKTYQDILKAYFPEMELAHIGGIFANK